MRLTGTAALLVVAALVGAVAASGASEQTLPIPKVGLAASKPRLGVGPLYPLTVRGAGFRSRELVTVALDGGRRGSKDVRSDRRGAFLVSFTVRIPRCGTVRIRATGARGSRATFQLQRPDCREP